MARIVGPSGTVVAADLQPQLLAGIKRRAEKSGLLTRIRFHRVDSLGLNFDRVFDSVLAFWMTREVQDQEAMLDRLSQYVKPGGLSVIAEPKGHVREAAFTRTVERAEKAGFKKI